MYYIFSDEKMYLGLIYAAAKLRVPIDGIITDPNVHIVASSVIGSFEDVMINGVRFKTRGIGQSVCVIIMGFLAFNLQHSVIYEDIIELIECLIGCRRRATKVKVCDIVSSLV